MGGLRRASDKPIIGLVCLLSFIQGSTAQSVSFTESLYTIEVPETFLDSYPVGETPHHNVDSPRPTGSILHVGCTDGLGGAADVTYFIQETVTGNIASNPGPFTIDPDDGNISVTADLDYEVKTFYELHVRCRDNVQSSVTDTATVIVDILPVNEVAPRVGRSTLSPIFVTEDQYTPGQVFVSPSDSSALRTIEVTDSDEGGDEELTYALSFEEDTPNGEQLSIDPETGTVSLTGTFDLDNNNFNGTSDVFQVTIVVCDKDPVVIVCPNVKFQLFIFAANDNAPLFDQAVYEVTVPESTPVGSTMDLGIVCTDGDRGAGSVTTIELANQNLLVWDVSIEGILTLREPLDYEMSQQHNFTIRCTDASNEDLATVIIRDNLLMFGQDMYEATVPENTPVGSTLNLGILCTNGNRSRGSVTTIELVPQQFTIWDMSSDGILTLRAPLNYETTYRFEFMIRCTDGIDEEVAKVIINVGSVNGGPLYFSQAQATIHVNRIEIPVKTLDSVQAVSNNSGDENTVKYSIIKDNENFDINEDTGEITLVDYIWAHEGNYFTLTVLATDASGNIATVEVKVQVTGLLTVPEYILVGVGAFLILFLTAIFFICLGAYLCFKWKRMPKRCTESAADSPLELKDKESTK